MKQILNIKTFLLLIILLSPALAMADPDSIGEIDTPIDGGLSLLIAAGVGYGAKKLKEKRNNNKVDKN